MSSLRLIAKDFLSRIEKEDWYIKYKSIVDTDIDTALNDKRQVRVKQILNTISLPTEFINSGCYRLTLNYRDSLAIKVSLFRNNSIDKEVKLLKLLQDEKLTKLSNYLCPVLASNNYVGIYPLCKPSECFIVTGIDGVRTIVDGCEPSDMLISTITNKFDVEDILLSDVSRKDQWGFLDNKLVLLDYADWMSIREKRSYVILNKDIDSIIRRYKERGFLD